MNPGPEVPFQQRLKARFVMPLFGGQALVLAVSAAALLATGGSPAWAGPLLPAGAFLAFMAWIVRSGAARTSAHLPWVLAASAAGFALAAAGSALRDAGVAAPLLAGLSLAGNLLYVFWYSRLPRRKSELLAEGRPLPGFSLRDADGRTVDSKEFEGRPAVFLFYRGNWCPLCMAQVREVADRYRELAARGAQVALVSPQPQERTRELAAQYDVPLRFLVDPDNRAAQQLGIAHAQGVPQGISGYDSDTVLPTVVVSDARGRIVLSDQTDNYRVRPEPEVFLRALDAAEPSARPELRPES